MKSVVGLTLGIVGSIFNLFLCILSFIFLIIVYFGRNALIDNNLSRILIEFSTSVLFWLIVLSIWFLIFGIIGLIGASMMNREQKVKNGGIICLISGLFTLNLFLIVGSLMGLIASREQVSFSSSVSS